MKAKWPAIRAGLIALVMAIGLLDGCPVPTGRQVDRLGPTVSSVIRGLDRARVTVLRPFRPIAELTQIRQRWQLFQGASHRRWRMHVEGAPALAGQPFQPLFIAGDDAHQTYADILHYRRMRGSWNPSGQNLRGSYARFCAWLNARVLADHPEFRIARVVFERIEIDPGGGYHPTGELLHEQRKVRR